MNVCLEGCGISWYAVESFIYQLSFKAWLESQSSILQKYSYGCHRNMEDVYNTAFFQSWIRLTETASFTECNCSLISFLLFWREIILTIQSHSFLIEHWASPLILQAAAHWIACYLVFCVQYVWVCVQWYIQNPTGLSKLEKQKCRKKLA